MWTIFAGVAVVLAQAAQPAGGAKEYEWCFDRDQGAQLCEETEAACNKLRDLNSEIAKSSCRRVYRPVVGLPPPPNPNPSRQTPTGPR
jgi:hypothetical protein